MPALSILTFLESEIAIKVIIDYRWQIIMLIFGDPENEKVTDWCLRTRIEKEKKLTIISVTTNVRVVKMLFSRVRCISFKAILVANDLTSWYSL